MDGTNELTVDQTYTCSSSLPHTMNSAPGENEARICELLFLWPLYLHARVYPSYTLMRESLDVTNSLLSSPGIHDSPVIFFPEALLLLVFLTSRWVM